MSVYKLPFLLKGIMGRTYYHSNVHVHCLTFWKREKSVVTLKVNIKNASNFRRHSSSYPQTISSLPNTEQYSAFFNNDLIIFNSFVNEFKSKYRKMQMLENRRIRMQKPVPVFIRYLSDKKEDTCQVDKVNDSKSTESINFPYTAKFTGDRTSNVLESIEQNLKNRPPIAYEDDCKLQNDEPLHAYKDSKYGKKWMNDYEQYTEEIDKNELGEWCLDYGSSDATIPVSNVPCGGCGAFLHCQDHAIPGYLPREIFLSCRDKDLLGITCQRCHFMKYYNTALAVTVDQELYPKLLQNIKNQNALVILMVDLTDFPCSIWPGILDLIGKKQPVVLVGNKIDLLWGDCKSWLTNVTNLLRASFPADANICHVGLVSARTGFGVEELINKLHNIWKYKGDVYLLGCTNVGKSTLFNLFLQSDYCKVKAVDLMQRATTSPWPGTTLNLLKFPILRPEGWRLHCRTLRLIKEREKHNFEKKMNDELLKSYKVKQTDPPQLIGHIGRTFRKNREVAHSDPNENFNVPNSQQMAEEPIAGSGLDVNDPDFAQSKWFYDTPGVLHKDQILDLLTTEELMLTIPKKTIEPRTFIMKPGWSLFVAGLARLDYTQGDSSIRLTVFSSSSLPITICFERDADKLYQDLLGTPCLLVPQGSKTRLEKWPLLQKSSDISLIGLDKLTSCADIVLSSAGWISVTTETKKICKFTPWTPQGRGVHVRCPPLLPNAVNLRGKRTRHTPSYSRSRPYRE